MLDFLYAAGAALSFVGLIAGAILTIMGSERVRDWRRRRPRPLDRRKLAENPVATALQPIDHPV